MDDDIDRGWYVKYKVERIGGTPHKHDDCLFFVLDLEHDKFALPALLAYAEACKEEYPRLQQDIYRWINGEL